MPVNRRQWLRTAGGLLAGAALLSRPRTAQAASSADEALVRQLQVCTPPGDPLEALLAGNRRFAEAWQAASGLASAEQRSQRLSRIRRHDCQVDPQALSRGQKPWLGLLTCADSRVAPDLVFACGSGEIFGVACAGNTAFDEAIASLEYAVSALGVPLIVVMGHSGCGAVKAALATEPLTPLLETLVRPIRASLVSGDSLTQAIEGNARHSAQRLTSRSALLQDAVATGRLTIRSAYLDIGSGLVTLL
jgi:carbonic anhydrase